MSSSTTTKEWSPTSWRSKPESQKIIYPSPISLTSTTSQLSLLLGLVSVAEIEKLKGLLRDVAKGHKFLLQGGDCAELFAYCNEDAIEKKLKVLLQMSLILTWIGKTPVVRIARMGGQYAKPRSSATETVNGVQVCTFRGDSVNGIAIEDRTPDPQRLLQAYFYSAATLNHVRQLLSSDFADLHHPDSWALPDWSWSQDAQNPILKKEYEEILSRLSETLEFMRVVGADDQGQGESSLRTVDLFMSHEGLLLEYESALTRLHKQNEKHYNLGTHFVWIGDRTRDLNGAHVEYFRGLENPIGVKVGPSMECTELQRLLDILDPECEPGRVTLITRYGSRFVSEHLPLHIQAVQDTKHQVVWVCDPMHGNTETTSQGIKTRRFETISSELSQAFEIHSALGTILGGVHFELTGDRVTETLGGNSKTLSERDLQENYQTHCDPRLNYEQSLDIAFLMAKCLSRQRLSLEK